MLALNTALFEWLDQPMRTSIKLLCGIAIVIVCLPSSMSADQPTVNREKIAETIKRLKRIPSEDEPEKLIRYLKGRNAVLEKQLAECQAKLRESQSRRGNNAPTEEDPYRGLEVPVQRPSPAQFDPLHVAEPFENLHYSLPRPVLPQR